LESTGAADSSKLPVAVGSGELVQIELNGELSKVGGREKRDKERGKFLWRRKGARGRCGGPVSSASRSHTLINGPVWKPRRGWVRLCENGFTEGGQGFI